MSAAIGSDNKGYFVSKNQPGLQHSDPLKSSNS